MRWTPGGRSRNLEDRRGFDSGDPRSCDTFASVP